MPTPGEGESEDDFVSRCIGVRQDEHPDEDVKQSTAICHSVYREAKKMEEIKEITDGPMLTAEHLGGSPSSASPAGVLPGQYPEVEEVELPDNLKPGAWRLDFTKEAGAECKDKDKKK